MNIERKPHRQICSICDEQCTVDFWVPNDVWELAIHESRINDLHCLRCFTRSADARFVDYSKMVITAIYPLVLHIGIVTDSMLDGYSFRDEHGTNITVIGTKNQYCIVTDIHKNVPYLLPKDYVLDIRNESICAAGKI